MDEGFGSGFGFRVSGLGFRATGLWFVVEGIDRVLAPARELLDRVALQPPLVKNHLRGYKTVGYKAVRHRTVEYEAVGPKTVRH